MIGSSLEASITLKLNNDLYKKFQNFDFEEVLITSSVEVINDNNITEKIDVVTQKAKGKKCPVCWKIRKNHCERHGDLC